MDSEAAVYVVLILAQMAGPVSGGTRSSSEILPFVLDALKILVPAILGYLHSRMQVQKGQRAAQATLREAGQEDEARASTEAMTAQARDLLAQASAKAAAATAAQRGAEVKVAALEQELALLRLELARLRSGGATD